MFGDRRGFAIEPVKAEIAEIAEKITPQEHLVGQMLGIDMQSPCPGAPALVAGPDGAQVVILVADRRALHAAVDAQTFAGAVANALAPTVGQLQRQLVTS